MVINWLILKSIFRDRGLSLASIVLILFCISLVQGSISYTLAFGTLRTFLPSDTSPLTGALVALRFGFISAWFCSGF
jgi:hypothetical protein